MFLIIHLPQLFAFWYHRQAVGVSVAFPWDLFSTLGSASSILTREIIFVTYCFPAHQAFSENKKKEILFRVDQFSERDKNNLDKLTSLSIPPPPSRPLLVNTKQVSQGFLFLTVS